jgi:hypothetical protein
MLGAVLTVDGDLRIVALRPVVLSLAAAALVVSALLTLLFVERIRITCTRAERGRAERDQSVCVIEQRSILGSAHVERIPSARIRAASLGVSTTGRAGAAPTHTDVRLALAMADGSERFVDEVSFAFIDPTFTAADVDSLNRFLRDESVVHAELASGGFATASLMLGALAILIAVFAFVWGKFEITLSVRDAELLVQGPEEQSRHAIAGLVGVLVDAGYKSLRLRYQDGTTAQTAKLGLATPELESLAMSASALFAKSRRT